MDAATASALAGNAALLSILYSVFGLFVVVGAFALLAVLGERMIGLNLRRFIDDVEARAAAGDVWGGVVCFIIIPAAVLCLVLFLGLR